jgi:hypothetical protein
MKMRIVVPDATSENGLADRPSIAFGAERISLRGDHREVDVRVERGSDRAVLRVLDAVDRCLDQPGVGSAEMRLGERSQNSPGGSQPRLGNENPAADRSRWSSHRPPGSRKGGPWRMRLMVGVAPPAERLGETTRTPRGARMRGNKR